MSNKNNKKIEVKMRHHYPNEESLLGDFESEQCQSCLNFRNDVTFGICEECFEKEMAENGSCVFTLDSSDSKFKKGW